MRSSIPRHLSLLSELEGDGEVPGERLWKALTHGIRCRRGGAQVKAGDQRGLRVGACSGPRWPQLWEGGRHADGSESYLQGWSAPGCIPAMTNGAWLNKCYISMNLRKIDEENRHTCPLLAYLNISLGTSFSFLQNTLVHRGNIYEMLGQ